MGLVLVPFLFGAFLIFLKALYEFYFVVQGNELVLEGVLLGISIPILIIILASIYWIKQGKVYAFQPHFFFTFALIFMPMLICHSSRIAPSFRNLPIMRTAFPIWIIFSGIILFPLFVYLIRFLEKRVKFFH